MLYLTCLDHVFLFRSRLFYRKYSSSGRNWRARIRPSLSSPCSWCVSPAIILGFHYSFSSIHVTFCIFFKVTINVFVGVSLETTGCRCREETEKVDQHTQTSARQTESVALQTPWGESKVTTQLPHTYNVKHSSSTHLPHNPPLTVYREPDWVIPPLSDSKQPIFFSYYFSSSQDIDAITDQSDASKKHVLSTGPTFLLDWQLLQSLL